MAAAAGGKKRRVSTGRGAGKLSQEISRPISSSGIGTLLLLYFHSWKMAPGSLAIRFTYLVQ
jgi:hypothetical protein